jgi:hypothetical protein
MDSTFLAKVTFTETKRASCDYQVMATEITRVSGSDELCLDGLDGMVLFNGGAINTSVTVKLSLQTSLGLITISEESYFRPFFDDFQLNLEPQNLVCDNSTGPRPTALLITTVRNGDYSDDHSMPNIYTDVEIEIQLSAA